MITHGKKQISEIVYARKASEGGGAVRLTNIIRGAQVVFGGIEIGMWMKFETRAAILAAFGQDDGYAVLGATNTYLNALAQTDKTKASALAGWLNTYAVEDARIVISLVPTLGERWIVGDGSAYIDTGRYMEANGCIDVKYRLGTFSNYPMLMGTNWNDNNGFAVDQSGSTTTQVQIRGYAPSYTVGQNDVTMSLQWDRFTINGKEVSTGKTAIRSSNTIWLSGVRSYSKWRGRLYYYIYKEDGAEVTHFIPYCKNNVNGLIDLISGTFYPPLAGTFGIEDSYTPLNQTP